MTLIEEARELNKTYREINSPENHEKQWKKWLSEELTKGIREAASLGYNHTNIMTNYQPESQADIIPDGMINNYIEKQWSIDCGEKLLKDIKEVIGEEFLIRVHRNGLHISWKVEK